VSLLGPACGVHTQCIAASAGLAAVTLARHVALGLVDAGAADQLVAAEALSTKLGAGQAETLGSAVGRALGICDLVVANVRERDARQHAGVNIVGEAALVGPASRDRAGAGARGWSRAWGSDRDGGHDPRGLSDI
jgi:hypothetical protein